MAVMIKSNQMSQEMLSTKLIITLWVRWKKPVKLAITLDPEDVEGNTGDIYIRVEMSFNNLITVF